MFLLLLLLNIFKIVLLFHLLDFASISLLFQLLKQIAVSLDCLVIVCFYYSKLLNRIFLIPSSWICNSNFVLYLWLKIIIGTNVHYAVVFPLFQITVKLISYKRTLENVYLFIVSIQKIYFIFWFHIWVQYHNLLTLKSLLFNFHAVHDESQVVQWSWRPLQSHCDMAYRCRQRALAAGLLKPTCISVYDSLPLCQANPRWCAQHRRDRRPNLRTSRRFRARSVCAALTSRGPLTTAAARTTLALTATCATLLVDPIQTRESTSSIRHRREVWARRPRGQSPELQRTWRRRVSACRHCSIPSASSVRFRFEWGESRDPTRGVRRQPSSLLDVRATRNMQFASSGVYLFILC